MGEKGAGAAGEIAAVHLSVISSEKLCPRLAPGTWVQRNLGRKPHREGTEGTAHPPLHRPFC